MPNSSRMDNFAWVWNPAIKTVFTAAAVLLVMMLLLYYLWCRCYLWFCQPVMLLLLVILSTCDATATCDLLKWPLSPEMLINFRFGWEWGTPRSRKLAKVMPNFIHLEGAQFSTETKINQHVSWHQPTFWTHPSITRLSWELRGVVALETIRQPCLPCVWER